MSKLALMITTSLILMGCQTSNDTRLPDTVIINSDIELTRLDDHLWLHTTWHTYPGFGRFPANGLLVINNSFAAMIDTPATNEQTSKLLDWLEKHINAKLSYVIPTHFHKDCMGGLAEAHLRGATSYANTKTKDIARKKHLPIPQNTFDNELNLNCGGTEIQLFYPGPGHTTDNIVAYFPESKILFGGCFIKASGSHNLGNTHDADVAGWANSLKKTRDRFPATLTLIPGHGGVGGLDLVTHTINLCENNQ